MKRSLFTRIVWDVTNHYSYFQLGTDCSGRVGIFALIKCNSALRQLTYNTVPDALDEYLQMNAKNSRDSLEHFCMAIMDLCRGAFTKTYLY